MADFLDTVKTTLGFSTEDTKGEEAPESTIIDPTTGEVMQPTEPTPNLDQNEEEGTGRTPPSTTTASPPPWTWGRVSRRETCQPRT